MFKGSDISAIQGVVDFVWLKNQGYSFTMVRCFVGNDYKDSMCNTNLQKAKDAGLYTGIYNFCYILQTDPAHPNRDPVSQANLHFANSPPDELCACDLEWPAPGSDWTKWNVSATFINDWVCQYLDRYEQLSGKKILVYTYPYFAQAVKFQSSLADYPLWYANYGNSPIVAPWTNWVMEQTSGGDQLTLPNGAKCDTDVVKDLSLWGVQELALITPPPIVNIEAALPPSSATIIPSPTTTAPTASANTSQINWSNVLTIAEKVMETMAPIITQIVKALFHIK